MTPAEDPVLRSIVAELKTRHRCHTIFLYGSRARGLVTPTSDYDVTGVRRDGRKTRIAKRVRGAYWDVFVYPEKDLRKLGDQHLSWKGARLLHAEGRYGPNLMKRLDALLRKPHRPSPPYELQVLKIWSRKQLDRCEARDAQGLFRRVELLTALVEHYFEIRKMRFWGPKAGFAWLEEHDPETFRRILRALRRPERLPLLKAAAARVYAGARLRPQRPQRPQRTQRAGAPGRHASTGMPRR
jgi:hypothetical protein